MVTTGERLMKLETQMETMSCKQDELHKTLKEFISTADKKYASKLTEKVVYGMIGVILSAVLIAILAGVTL